MQHYKILIRLVLTDFDVFRILLLQQKFLELLNLHDLISEENHQSKKNIAIFVGMGDSQEWHIFDGKHGKGAKARVGKFQLFFLLL